MKTVKITESFDGYPSGDKRVSYTAGETVDVPATFAENIIGKGYAKEVAKKASKSDAEDSSDKE